MSVCMLCGHPAFNGDALCSYHLAGTGDDWAAGNRIMCDFSIVASSYRPPHAPARGQPRPGVGPSRGRQIACQGWDRHSWSPAAGARRRAPDWTSPDDRQ